MSRATLRHVSGAHSLVFVSLRCSAVALGRPRNDPGLFPCVVEVGPTYKQGGCVGGELGVVRPPPGGVHCTLSACWRGGGAPGRALPPCSPHLHSRRRAEDNWDDLVQMAMRERDHLARACAACARAAPAE
eukprot:gene16499-biopygen6768